MEKEQYMPLSKNKSVRAYFRNIDLLLSQRRDPLAMSSMFKKPCSAILPRNQESEDKRPKTMY